MLLKKIFVIVLLSVIVANVPIMAKQKQKFVDVPSGSIIMWAGFKHNVPKGWAICDGTNGTPDLSDKFIPVEVEVNRVIDIEKGKIENPEPIIIPYSAVYYIMKK